MNDIEKLENSKSVVDFLTSVSPLKQNKMGLERLSRVLERLSNEENIPHDILVRLLFEVEKEYQTEKEFADEIKPYFYTGNGGKSKVNLMTLAHYFSQNECYYTIENTIDDKEPGFYFYNTLTGKYARISRNAVIERISSYIIGKCDIEYKTSMGEEVYKQLCQKTTNAIERGKLKPQECFINFKNGVLNIETLELKEHSPNYNFTNQIPCNWNADAKTPETFSRFFNTLTDNDQEIKTFLLQFIGLVVSNVSVSKFKQSSPWLYGKGNTGKSQFFKLVEYLVGKENYECIDLDTLEKNTFALGNIENKRLLGSADNKLSHIRELSRVKGIIGGDTVRTEQKFKNSYDTQYDGAFLNCANALPDFSGDLGQWVYNRFVPIHCKNVIAPEDQDPNILDKMKQELDGIVYLAITEFRKVYLQETKKLSIPNQSKEDLEKHSIENDPVLTFFTECCIMRPDATCNDDITVTELLEIFQRWYKLHYPGRKAITTQMFNTRMCNYLNVESKEDLMYRKTRARYYKFTLSTFCRYDQ